MLLHDHQDGVHGPSRMVRVSPTTFECIESLVVTIQGNEYSIEVRDTKGRRIVNNTAFLTPSLYEFWISPTTDAEVALAQQVSRGDTSHVLISVLFAIATLLMIVILLARRAARRVTKDRNSTLSTLSTLFPEAKIVASELLK